MSTQGFCAVLAAGCVLMALAGESPFVGTWKLNVEKSKLEGIAIDLGSTTARVEPDGAGLRGTVEITTPQGQIYRYSYPITLDGRPIKVTGTPEYDEIETRRVDDRTFTAICKKDGAGHVRGRFAFRMEPRVDRPVSRRFQIGRSCNSIRRKAAAKNPEHEPGKDNRNQNPRLRDTAGTEKPAAEARPQRRKHETARQHEAWGGAQSSAKNDQGQTGEPEDDQSWNRRESHCHHEASVEAQSKRRTRVDENRDVGRAVPRVHAAKN